MSSPLSPIALRDLFFKPSRFFRRGAELMKRPEALIVGWIAGMALAIDRADINMLRADVRDGGGNPILNAASGSWGAFWIYVVLSGALSGWIMWWLGGWWYRMRLRWSRAFEPDHALVRAVWAYQSFVIALPTLIVVLIQTFVFPSYSEAWRAEEYWSGLVLLFVPWSCIVSYTAATTAFTATRGRAALWFIALPLAFYMIAVIGLAGLYVMLGGE